MKIVINFGHLIFMVLFSGLLNGQTILRKDFLQELYSNAFYSSKLTNDTFKLGCIELGDQIAINKDFIMEVFFAKDKAYFKSTTCSDAIPYDIFVKDHGDTMMCFFTFAPSSPESFRYLIEAINNDLVYVTIYAINRRGNYKERRRAVFRILE